ncbi:MAG TPA: transglutaminase-like domain-containing protein [Nitrospirales bacterium]|nr:transglutaminase-like domain-containing protein [Nitrospirales bacterium]
MIPETQIRALIRLLSDEDNRVARTISSKLVEIGDSAVPLLLEAEIEQPEMARRIEEVLDEIRGSRLEEELQAMVARPPDQVDLERCAFLICRYAFSSLDVTTYTRQLDEMAGEVRDRMGRRVSGEEAVKTLNRYLFTEQGFRGNTKNYYEADNSYLNRVLDRKTGIPISLAMVYLLVGRRLGLPVYGIGMPGHFLVKFESERYKVFVDCFNSGALLTEKDCARFLIQAGYGFEEKYLHKSLPTAILTRTLKNLIAIYNKMDECVKAERFTRFIHVLEGGKKTDCDA